MCIFLNWEIQIRVVTWRWYMFLNYNQHKIIYPWNTEIKKNFKTLAVFQSNQFTQDANVWSGLDVLSFLYIFPKMYISTLNFIFCGKCIVILKYIRIPQSCLINRNIKGVRSTDARFYHIEVIIGAFLPDDIH